MTAVLAPFGFRPMFHPSGGACPRMKFGSVETPPTHGLYTNQPVTIDSSGNFQPAVVYGTPNTVVRVDGIFGGIEYADQNGFVHESPQFLEGQITFNSAASGVNTGNTYSTFTKPYVYQDTQIEFMVQFNGTVTKAVQGKSFDIDVTTIDSAIASTGLSTVALNTAVVANLGGNFIVTELAQVPNNSWGDAYPIVMVKLNITKY